MSVLFFYGSVVWCLDGAHQLTTLWIWWMKICCKISQSQSQFHVSHLLLPLVLLLLLPWCGVALSRGEKKTGREMFTLFSNCKRRIFMLMNLIDHYGFGWQKAPKTIHVPRPLPLLLLRLLLPLHMNFGAMDAIAKRTAHTIHRRNQHSICHSMVFGLQSVCGM